MLKLTYFHLNPLQVALKLHSQGGTHKQATLNSHSTYSIPLWKRAAVLNANKLAMRLVSTMEVLWDRDASHYVDIIITTQSIL